MDISLKHCPFCGSNNVLASQFPLDYPNWNVRSFVSCECGAEMHKDGNINNCKECMSSVINAWNKREGGNDA